MKKTKVGIVVGYGSAILGTFAEAVRELAGEGYDFEIQARQQKEEIDDDFCLWLTKKADVIVLNIGSYYEKSYTALSKIAATAKVPVFSLEYAEKPLSNVDIGQLGIFSGYFMNNGLENIKNMLLFLAKYCGNFDGEVDPPKEMPWQGIWHPDATSIFDSVRAYQDWYGRHKKKGVDTVGLLFYRTAWIEKNARVEEAIIRQLEKRGCNVIPVFSYPFGGEETGIQLNDEVIRRFFFINDKPSIDILIYRECFYIKSEIAGKWVDPAQKGMNILQRLNVPVLKAMVTYYDSVDEWRKSDEGVGPLETVMEIMMPEVDGVIEPLLVGASEKITESAIGGEYEKYEPIPERIAYLADRAQGWIKLRKTLNRERKVAIILLNNPCAGVEATVAGGFGLDTMESLLRLLKKMKEQGYNTGEWLPETSKELIDTWMERKAISEFRWTPISEVVRCGGAAALVERDLYLKWFHELPEKNRKEMIDTWGDPRSDFTQVDKIVDSETGEIHPIKWAKLSMGLHEDKIVIPGLIFGNVFVCIEPKRGCAGARCDGRVCKILHDPTCPPPHQWLAVHRWIEREFKTDVVVHWGTHALHEFTPGKGCGLSEECYPEISIGKMPHLYVYSISNPMEGTTAKRRGYAAIIDHLTPVMAPTSAYDELADLEDLLAQHTKAKTMNDSGRLKILVEQIVEKSRQANLYKEFENPDEFIDHLHGKLTLLQETQFRDGMHILGEAPHGEGLVNLLVGMLRYDAGEHPSIRRVALEAMGLQYDEIVDNPADINKKLGKTNGKLLAESTLMSIDIMQKVLEEVQDVG